MKKPTIKIVLDKRDKRADGTYRLCIRVTHNRKRKYIHTGYYFTEEDFELASSLNAPRKMRNALQKVIDKKEALQDVCNDMDQFSFDALDSIPHKTKGIVSNLKRISKELEDKGQVGTSDSYLYAAKSIENFCGEAPVSSIDVAWLEKYESWMIKNEKSLSTVGVYLRYVRRVFNDLISEGEIDRNLYPFGRRKYIVPSSTNKHVSIPVEDVKRIFDHPCWPECNMEFCRDLWVFSFLCDGMNLKDIAALKQQNIQGDILTFIRGKTSRTTRAKRNSISIYLNETSKYLIDKYKNDGPYIFDIYKEGMTDIQKLHKSRSILGQINKWMKLICQELNIEKKVTFNVARHSWAAAMQKYGMDLHYIKSQLGHTSLETTKEYLDGFDLEKNKQAKDGILNRPKRLRIV